MGSLNLLDLKFFIKVLSVYFFFVILQPECNVVLFLWKDHILGSHFL